MLLIYANRAIVFPVMLVLVLLLAAWLSYRRFVFARRAMSLDWPPGLSRNTVYRLAKYYLRKQGWLIADGGGVWSPWVVADSPYTWGGINLSATKEGMHLHIFIPQRKGASLLIQLNDIDDVAAQARSTVTVVAYDERPEEVSNIKTSPRLLIISPPQLKFALDLLRAHKAGLRSGDRGSQASPNPNASEEGKSLAQRN